jgi:hypothetical protein
MVKGLGADLPACRVPPRSCRSLLRREQNGVWLAFRAEEWSTPMRKPDRARIGLARNPESAPMLPRDLVSLGPERDCAAYSTGERPVRSDARPSPDPRARARGTQGSPDAVPRRTDPLPVQRERSLHARRKLRPRLALGARAPRLSRGGPRRGLDGSPIAGRAHSPRRRGGRHLPIGRAATRTH